MIHKEHKAKSGDVIGMLSAFDIALEDARSVLAIAFETTLHMTQEEYDKAGAGMRFFASLQIKQDTNDNG